MRKAALFVLLLVFSASMASAATVRDSVKGAGENVRNFFAKEGERSGLKDSTSGWGKFWGNINPMGYFKSQEDAYNARKSGSVKK